MVRLQPSRIFHVAPRPESLTQPVVLPVDVTSMWSMLSPPCTMPHACRSASALTTCCVYRRMIVSLRPPNWPIRLQHHARGATM